MTEFQPRDPQFRATVRDSFNGQTALQALSASLLSVEPGLVSIRLDCRDGLAGTEAPVHRGIAAAVLASACEFAALSLARPGAKIVPVENKVNFTSAEQTGPLVAYGEVVRSGGTITVCKGYACAEGDSKQAVAHMLATYITGAPITDSPQPGSSAP